MGGDCRESSSITEAPGGKKTLAIAVFYDPDGIADDYFIYFLSSLKSIADRLIVVVNGKLAEGEDRLADVADDIYVRQNTGFDFGAYRDAAENYLKPGEMEGYEELILCNDTCFGPFVPFKDIFLKMSGRGLKFWSMNYVEDLLLPHFQSYFMVFREEAISFVLKFLHKEVDDRAVDMAQAHGYEHGLSEEIMGSGLKTDYYTSGIHGYHDIDIFGAPDYAMKKLGFPFLKKKCFSRDFGRRENCLEALRMVCEEGKYPVRLILECVRRIYGAEFPEEEIKMPHLSDISVFEKNAVSGKAVIQFCRQYKKVYVYGNGYVSALFMARFRRYMEEFGGYVVSDEYFVNGIYKGDKVYALSYIGKDVPLIIALGKESSWQVADKVRGRKNVMFLSINISKKANNGEDCRW